MDFFELFQYRGSALAFETQFRRMLRIRGIRPETVAVCPDHSGVWYATVEGVRIYAGPNETPYTVDNDGNIMMFDNAEQFAEIAAAAWDGFLDQLAS